MSFMWTIVALLFCHALRHSKADHDEISNLRGRSSELEIDHNNGKKLNFKKALPKYASSVNGRLTYKFNVNELF
jgi:hypothetical protein